MDGIFSRVLLNSFIHILPQTIFVLYLYIIEVSSVYFIEVKRAFGGRFQFVLFVGLPALKGQNKLA